MERFTPEARAKLERILDGNDALIDDLERDLGLAKLLVEDHSGSTPLNADERNELKDIRKAVDGLREMLSKPHNDKTHNELMLRLMLYGQSGRVDPDSVNRALRSAPTDAAKLVPDNDQITAQAMLMGKVIESNDRVSEGLPPVEFVELMAWNLEVLSTVIEEILAVTVTGRPKELLRPRIASGVAALFVRHGQQPKTTRGGPFEQTLCEVLREAGAYVPANPEDLRPILREAIRRIKQNDSDQKPTN